MNFKPLSKSKQFALELFNGLREKYYHLKDQLMTVYQNEIDEMDKIYNFYDERRNTFVISYVILMIGMKSTIT
ncbi:hypothetical protein PAPYR_10794 [Paratrimastix pyriformis]|uniref:Uncharacterized protein n=1 Tax=Paratrimastix pyriformis TaxID=342808 RepID=A0ABQ8UA50_9EUKA|nr:hypothetical protein PAPYR_10794 [Paratrimastix pyriformis]